MHPLGFNASYLCYCYLFMLLVKMLICECGKEDQEPVDLITNHLTVYTVETIV